MSAATPNTFSSSALLVPAGAASAGRNSPAAASSTGLQAEAGGFKDTLQQLRPEVAAARAGAAEKAYSSHPSAQKPSAQKNLQPAPEEASLAQEALGEGQDESASQYSATDAMDVSTQEELLAEPQPELAPLVAEAVLPSRRDGLIAPPLGSNAAAAAVASADAASITEVDTPEIALKNSLNGLLSEETLASGDDYSGADDMLSQPKLAEAAKPPAVLEGLLRQQEAALAPAARAFVPQTGLAHSFGQSQWSQAVGERVLWLAAQNLSVADIRLDPPELGSLQVRVTVNQEQASVTFVTPHAQVREVLDQQATRLREMFAEQGLNLVNVDVSERRQQAGSGQQDDTARAEQEADEELQLLGETSPQELRLVDHYA